MTVGYSDDRDDPDPSSQLPDQARLTLLATATIAAEGLAEDTMVEIALIDEATMTELNESHMGKSGSTDVLSFPLENLVPGVVPTVDSGGPPLHLGDIFICPSVVARNAQVRRVRFQDEMALMVVHGLLHLLGYDHVADADAEQMEQRERDLLSTVGVVRP